MKSIYAITPSGVNFEKLIKEIEKMLSMGIKLFQYREKGLSEEQMKINASIMLEVINKNNGKLIINDSPKIAIEIGADGFHLGMEDYLNPKNLKFIKEHKDMINSDYIKGLSCKWDCKLIKNPPEDLITWNYLGIGAFFKSETKENVSFLEDGDKSFPLSITSKPLVAIGGINYQNMDSVLSLGYETIAMSKGIFFKKDVENIIKNLNEKN